MTGILAISETSSSPAAKHGLDRPSEVQESERRAIEATMGIPTKGKCPIS